jgi:hypothetical protein
MDFSNLQKSREIGNSSGESGLQARLSVVVPCTRRVPHFGVLRFFSLLPFSGINNLHVFNALSSSIPTISANPLL